MISESLFAEHCIDIISDVPKYLEQAGKDAPCAKCDGTGKRPLPKEQDALIRELCFGLMHAAGAHTNHTMPGDPCAYCGGFGIDEKKQRQLAARALAHDWIPTMKELFDPLGGDS